MMRRSRARALALALACLAACARGEPPPTRAPPPPLDPVTSSTPTSPGARVVPGRARWIDIPAPANVPADREPARALALGRGLLAFHPQSPWLAAFDACERRWRPLDPLPQGLARVAPVVLDEQRAAFCCGPPERRGALVDLAAGVSAIPSIPLTPYPGRAPVALREGLLIPTDKRYDVRARAWRVLPFTPEIQAATAQQGSAIASSGAHVLIWGGQQGGVVAPGGALFDLARGGWRLVSRTGAPSPRSDAVALWTGRDFFVYGGELRGAQLADGGRYDPAADRWQPLAGPRFGGPLAATLAGAQVLVWDGARGGAYDLRTGRWREFIVPAPSVIQDRPQGHGGLAVVTAKDAFVLDPERLEWARTPLPPALVGRNRRVHVLTRSHLIVWGGERVLSSGGCENPPPDVGCDPHVETQGLYDGAALPLAPCR